MNINISNSLKRQWQDPVIRAKRTAGLGNNKRIVFTPEMDAIIYESINQFPTIPWTIVAEKIGVDISVLRRRRDELGIIKTYHSNRRILSREAGEPKTEGRDLGTSCSNDAQLVGK